LNMLQEEERRRIAHELHDELGQRLTALRMETSLLPHKLGKRGTRAASEAITSMIELIDETIVTVRRVATELRPAILDDFGFRAALELELAALQKRSGLNYSIHFVPEHLTVDREMATTLYRIVQESLTNVARHAQASTVRVGVEQHDDWIVIEIADDGRGITPEELSSSASLGLLGIRERAYAHGGVADVRAGPRGGTVVSVRLPVGERR
ncbi:MAG TPA: sensor histidine kinase, partial [Thermoanaerobaculia bacterium]|nr:sensor histidine kinase [Thermoanaerobaculia bacterium]